MRSALFAILAAVILSIAFFGYTVWQSTKDHGSGKAAPVVDPPPPRIEKTTAHGGPLLPGTDPEWENYGEDGLLKSRFKAHEYTPRANGQIDVTLPVAEFFMPNHQIMKLSGKTGEMEIPDSGSSSKTSSSSAAPMASGGPSRGRIHDVTIEIFNMFPDSNPNVPDETIITDNVQFDNQTMLITTESYTDASGKMIPADEVKVHMTSPSEHRGYDFDGRGLKVRWNDKDGRLEMLEIAHGEQLTIKDASASGPLGQPEKAAKPAPLVSAISASREPATPTPKPTGRPNGARPAPKPAAKAPAPPVPYLATFNENVHITQGPSVSITGDEMDIDFVSRGDQPNPTTAPSSQPSKNSATQSTNANAKGTGTANSTKAATRPATQPNNEPVIVRWTGKLTMLPNQPNRPQVAPGDSIVELIGKPVRIRRSAVAGQQGDDIRTGTLTYRTSDGSLTLLKSESTPEVILSKIIDGKIDPQTTITTSTLDYKTDPAGRKVAILTGPGHAAMPMQSSTTQPSVEMMDTTWKTGATAYFAGKSQDDLEIQHVDLAGVVNVKHPQLAMNSEKLALDFAPQTAVPSDQIKNPNQKHEQQLTRAVATESVHCDLTGSNGKKQTIDCQNLDVRTARDDEGRFYAKQVNATGKAHAHDADQDLTARSIELTLRPVKSPTTKPTTKPAGDSTNATTELEKLYARDRVRVVNKDGAVATGSELTVTTEDGSPHVRLIGAPAQVIDAKKNVIQGPLVTVDQGIAHVIGDGKMHMLQESASGGPPKPMDVLWTDQAIMAGKENRVDILGSVIVRTQDADGTVNVANGDHVHIDLMDKVVPTTRPSVASTRPAAATRPAIASTQPAKKDSADAMQLDVGKDKDVRTITIDGNALVNSTLTAPDGVPVRQFLLKAPKIIYDLADEKGAPVRQLVVPSDGQMMLSDRRPPDKAKVAATNPADPMGGGRGDTAFQWNKQLVYSELQRQAVMTGDVVVVHDTLPVKGEGERVRIESDKVTASFEQPPKAKVATTQPAAGDSAMQLKYLTADGNVTVTRSNKATLTAERIDYDPHTHWMFAHGTANRPAKYTDPDPKRRPISAQELQWNTDSWQIEMSNTRSNSPK